jgi:SAM-dependent methyltransferase
MHTDDQFSWYESSLPSDERKMRGHFSTPPQLVSRMLDACGYHAERDLTHLHVLDPACGSGNFLAGAACRLLASGQRLGYRASTLATLMRNNLWGFDPDPVSCFLAEMQLRAVLPANRHKTVPPLHIHQADGLIFPWEQSEHIDIFLTNPPYLAAKNNDLSGYLFTRQRGQSDSYLLFLDLALRVVRPGGWIGLVLPDPVLARMSAARERRRLLTETTIHHLWHLSGVFKAYVGAVVIIAQKKPPARHHALSWVRASWRSDQEWPQESQAIGQAAIEQTMLSAQPGAELRYLLAPGDPNPGRAQEGRPQGCAPTMDERISEAPSRHCRGDPCGRPSCGLPMSLIAQLWQQFVITHFKHARFIPLASLFDIKRGEEIGKAASLLYDGQNNGQVSRAGEWYPVIRGGSEVRPYSACQGSYWIARQHIVKPLQRYLLPKILVVKSTGSLQAALDLQGHVVLQTLYLLYPRATNQHDSLDDLYFVLALLNSLLLQQYVYVLWTAYKWVQPQIEQHVLACLPIPLVDKAEKTRIVQRAKLLVEACREGARVVELELYEEQERAIQALYQTTLEKV